MMTLTTKIGFSLLGGWISRIKGGGKPKLPVPAQWIWAIPYGFLFTGSWWGLPVYVCAALGKRTASYPYLFMGNISSVDTTRNPPMDFIVKWMFGPISPNGGQFWRCYAGFAVEGLATTLMAGSIYAYLIDPVKGAILAASGLLKPLAYAIELYLFKYKIIKHQDVIAEILDGLFLWGVLSCLF